MTSAIFSRWEKYVVGTTERSTKLSTNVSTNQSGNILVGAQKGVTLASTNAVRVRLAALSFAVAGILFVLYPAIRPFSDEVSLQGAAAFASPQWILAHVLAILGFILMTLALLGLYLTLQEMAIERTALLGLVLSWIGVGLTLPFYGAEVFGLHAIGQAALSQNNPSLLDLANQVRFGPGFYVIITGLLLLAVGGIFVAVAIWKSQLLPKWSGIPFALGFALYIPQYVATQPIRVAHGLLIAAGCLWIAVGIWQRGN
jgi:hypothetical protein